MTQPVDDLQRFGFKLFLEPDTAIETRVFIPVFHRWIQTHATDDLLIDVADYTHLSDGPTVLLAGHEGNYAIDRSEGRVGLYYYRKQPTTGPLADRLVTVARTVIKAGMQLEAEGSIGSICRFRGNEIQFVSNDRLRAPARRETFEALVPVLDAFAKTLFPGDVRVNPSRSQDRLRLNVIAPDSHPLSDLLDRIS